MKRIWIFCLCLASLSLVGCFHVPDEDWLPSKNKVETWNIQKDTEVEDAINSLTDWVNLISSQRDEKNNKVSESEDIIMDEENESIIDESTDLKIEDDIPEQ